MKKLLIQTVLFFVSLNVFAADHFEFQETGTTNTLKAITFVNNSTGFCVGNLSTLLRTSNGGVNWINIDVSSSTTNYNSVAFANASTGFAVSDDGELIKTTNGGFNWSITAFSSNALKYVYFFDSNVGFIGGANSTLHKTTNGGNNWISVSPGITETIVKIVMYDNTHGFFLTRQSLDSGSVYKTTNGGLNWQRLNNFYSGYTGQRALFDCVPLNRDTVYVSLGYYMTGIMRTTNGGENWQRLYDHWMTYISPGSLYQMHFIDRNNLIAMNGPTDGAPCYLIKSTNGGFNFTHPSAIRLSGYMYGGYFSRNNYSFYACGESGKIIKVYSYITSVSSNNQTTSTQSSFSVSGNPSDNIITITSLRSTADINKSFEVKIFDSLGRLVKADNFNSASRSFNISSLPSGIYYLKISSAGNEFFNKKFLRIK